MTCQRATGLILLYGATLFAIGATAPADGASNVKEQTAPRGEIRILYNADTGTIMKQLPRQIRREEDLYPFVDQLAANGVDVYIPDAFSAGMTLWNSALSPRWDQVRLPSYTTNMVKQTFEAGFEPIAIWAGRCHEKEMKIVPSFRMNDRHSQGKLNDPDRAAQMGPFLKDNVRLWMKTYPGGLDYAHKESRDYMFSLMAELVAKFDVDGLDLNYMRWCHVFDPGDPDSNIPILNAFMKRVRRMLDQAGRNKGHRLLLGVTVPPSLQECRYLSFDVATWVAEGLIDYVAPMAFNDTDFDAAYEDFARLTRKSDCMLFPAANPYVCTTYKRILMSLPAYRGLARNFYAQGAGGVYAFNYMYHWSGMEGMSYPGPPDMYPKALAYFKELRDPAELSGADRHYVSYPWPAFHGLTDRTKKILLDRSAAPASGQYTFRAAEDFSGQQKALVEFNAVGLLPGDKIQVTFNGTVVPQEKIERTFHEEGRTREEEGAKLPAYTTCRFAPAAPSGRFGENTLAVKLIESAQGATDVIDVREIEVAVSGIGKEPSEIMDMIHERRLPPLPVLAGYRAHYSSVWKERTRSANFGGEPLEGGRIERRKLAQRFVLKDKSVVSAIDVFVYPRHPTRQTVVLSVETDGGGRPGGTLAAPGARATFNPLEHPFDPRNTGGTLNLQCQGYYTFVFDEPLNLDPGDYWFVLEVDSDKDRYEDVSDVQTYRAHMTTGRYADGIVQRWTPKESWRTIGETTFFGVHGRPME